MEHLLMIRIYGNDRLAMPFDDISTDHRYEANRRRMRVYLFKRQLHVAIIVIIVHVVTPVMHREEGPKAYFAIDTLMLGKVFKKYGQLEELMKFSGAERHQSKQYVNAYFLH